MKWFDIRARSFAMMVAVAVLSAVWVVQASGSCIDFEASLQPGETVEVTVTDQAWIDLEVRYDHVVRFTMSAVPDTALEVWSLDYIEGEDCFDLLVPAAASSSGAFGTRWQTDLRVVPSGVEIGELDVTFFPNDGSGSATKSFEFVGPGPLAVDDVVSRIGASGAGRLWLHSPGGTMLATSRTYTVGDDGSCGQFIPASWSFEDLERGVVLGLKGSSEYRSNIGLVNPGDQPIEAELRLVSAAGEVLGSRVATVAANRGRQINDVFSFFGVAGCDLCRLEFDAEAAIGRDDLYVWGSVIDNRTGDAVFVPPLPF
jgi:hypothetical protein